MDLSIGLSYDEYGDRVGDARVAYDQLPVNDLARTCLKKVAVNLESALQKYIDVFNVWGDCIEDYYCDFSEGKPNDKAQTGWYKAGNLIEDASAGLESMLPK